MTSSCVASVIRGTILAGYCVVKQLLYSKGNDCRLNRFGETQKESTRSSVLIRTYNDPAAFASLTVLVMATEHTGIAAADFRISASHDRHPVFIDYNPRMSFFASLSTQALGISAGPLDALFEALSPSASDCPRRFQSNRSGSVQQSGKGHCPYIRPAVLRQAAIAKFRPYDWASGGCDTYTISNQSRTLSLLLCGVNVVSLH